MNKTQDPVNNPGLAARLSMAAPSLSDNTADADRLIRAAERVWPEMRIRVAPEIWPELPALFRETGFTVNAAVFPEGDGLTLVDAAPEDALPALGLAVDLGTTRLGLRLLDLSTGENLGEAFLDNPQIAVGPDILTRIHHADTEEGRDGLARSVRRAISEAARELAKGAGSDSSRIAAAAIAGNTAMTHLLLGLPVRNMIREPYIPVVNRPGTLPARSLDLDFSPACRIFVFPNIGSYFGGDLVAGILATGMDQSPETALLVDVGTNAEVVVGNRDWLMACAGAAGPALEGGVTRMGMAARPGAIDRVHPDPETGGLAIHAIDEKPPIGICGSGVIDLAAALFLTGRMDIRGKLVSEALGERLTERDGKPALVVAPAEISGTSEDLVFTQADLDSLTRSKAAMYTILRTLFANVGLAFEDLSRFYVAGTFGTVIDPESAIAIGMLPDIPREVFHPVGNTSLAGATRALTDAGAAVRAQELSRRITYMELNVNQEFMNRFSAAKFYPHTEASRFPTVMAKKNGH